MEILEAIVTEINIAVVRTGEAVIEEIFMVNISMEVTRVEINIKEDGEIKNEVLCTEKASSKGGAVNTYTFFAETENSKVFNGFGRLCFRLLAALFCWFSLYFAT
jgi:hypothetical protein